MNCPNCQHSIPEGAKFCMNCGQAVTTTEPAPSVTPTPTAEVGTAHTEAHLTGERRTVTVMFTDLSGFTAMSEKMGPEQVRSLINNCFDQLAPVVEKYEGVVDKFIGDEIMALFGAPVAHEDDPARALRAALEIMDTLENFNAEYNTNLGVHAGINTGLVVAGGIGSQGRQQYSVMGDTVNLGARLESASERGEIFVGPDTYAITAPLFEFEALEPIRVKGKAEPIQVYKLLDTQDKPGQVRGLAGLESPMVGRDAELTALLQASDATLSGLGRVAIISGEPGLGKTRLISEWQAATTVTPTDDSPPQSKIQNPKSTGLPPNAYPTVKGWLITS